MSSRKRKGMRQLLGAPPTEVDTRVPQRLLHGKGSYRLLRMIGSGSYGEVFLAERQDDARQRFAIKCVTKADCKEDALKRFVAECSFLRRLDHPNILRYVEDIETPSHHFLVTELSKSGDLLGRINAFGKLSESKAKNLFRQLVAALQHAHSEGIVHRDFKLENILIVGDDTVKLADWGFAMTWCPGHMHTQALGSQQYAAPELWARRPYLGPELDCWSLGVVLYAMVAGTLPFYKSTASDEDTKETILKCEYRMPNHLSTSCSNLIHGLLWLDQRTRMKLSDVVHHPWFLPTLLTSPDNNNASSPMEGPVDDRVSQK